jgi:hypothetical protein
LVSADRRLGFIVINVVLLAFGLWSFFFPVRHRWPSAGVVIAVWASVEVINGIGHPLWTLWRGGYTPGVITAPVLLVIALAVLWEYRRQLRAGSTSRA